eukprot:NODE_7_length_67686_cov_1.621421.p5 type:complete len:646 gc:universal NODE_7_length_67686_cov_1.621421:64527-62590(-)
MSSPNKEINFLPNYKSIFHLPHPMFERFYKIADYQKCLIVPCTRKMTEQLEDLFVPDDIMIILWVPNKIKIRLNFLGSGDQGISPSKNNQLIKSRLHGSGLPNVLYMFDAFYNWELFACLLGYFSKHRILTTVRTTKEFMSRLLEGLYGRYKDEDYKVYTSQLLKDIALLFPLVHMDNISDLHDVVFDSIPKKYYDILQISMKGPVEVSQLRKLCPDNIICNFFSFKKAAGILTEKNGTFCLKKNKFANFIKEIAKCRETETKSRVSVSLQRLQEFYNLNFDDNDGFCVKQYSTNANGQSLYLTEIRISEMIFQTTLNIEDLLENNIDDTSLFLFKLMDHGHTTFGYFQGLKKYITGEINLMHDQLMFSKCRALVSKDSFFPPSKYVAFAENYFKSFFKHQPSFIFVESIKRLNHYIGRLEIPNLGYSIFSKDCISKSNCKEDLCIQFCKEFGVIQYLFDANHKLITQESYGKITIEELKNWISTLPMPRRTIHNSAEISKKRMIVTDTKLPSTKKRQKILSGEEVTYLCMDNNFEICFDRKDDCKEINTKQQNIFDFKKAKPKTINSPGFDMSELSKIESFLFYDKYLIHQPNPDINLQCIKSKALKNWNQISETEKIDFWKYSKALNEFYNCMNSILLYTNKY